MASKNQYTGIAQLKALTFIYQNVLILVELFSSEKADFVIINSLVRVHNGRGDKNVYS